MDSRLPALVRDMLAVCDRIGRFCVGCDEAGFCADSRLRAAVEYELIKLGGRLFRARQLCSGCAELGASAQRVARLWPTLVHDYNSVVPDQVWRTVTDDIPVLSAALLALQSTGDA